jgi:arylsulfatase A-like enzyme
MKLRHLGYAIAYVLFCSIPIPANVAYAKFPNVVLILTDDQGYGDLSCHGNPILETPALDQLHSESVRFTDLHVMPFCTPTRASLMTGRCATRTGAYRTSSGRTMLHTDEVTMAEVFQANGYSTGIFGKWHLGDSYPHRPQDRGFRTTLWHRCGGVGQASDYWGNTYFDDTYEHNGKFEKFAGYCTDIWFQGALSFIEDNAKQQKPFFVYLPTNAPHGPYRVPESYAEPYEATATWSKSSANFFGMIANIDENVANLRKKLVELGIDKDTLLIFMTDNGTSAGVRMGLDDVPGPGQGYNAGMRGRKSSVYDGGHRVPCFFHWPDGGLTGGRDVPKLAAGYDILPTLIDLCGLKQPNVKFDGRSLTPLLRGEGNWPARELVLQFQGGAYFARTPQPWLDSVVMTEQWRLMDGERLYDIEADPTQSVDIADKHPEVVRRLRERYETWWKDVSPRMTPVRIHVGNEAEDPVTLCSQDWYMPIGNPPWNFGGIGRLPAVTGPWQIHVERAGRYRVSLCQWPKEANKPIVAQTARVKIAGVEASGPVEPGAVSVSFEMALPAGDTTLETWLSRKDGKVSGAYFAYVEYLKD